MIAHFCISPSDSRQRLFSGRQLSYWFAVLFPELTWIPHLSSRSSDTVFVWNPTVLPMLKDFHSWHERQTLPDNLQNQCYLDPQRIFLITSGDQLASLTEGDLDFETLCQNITPSRLPVDSEPYPALTDPIEIQLAIRSFQYSHYCERGVSFADPASFYIEGLPEIGKGTHIHHGVVIEGDTTIADGVRIGPNVHLINAFLGAESAVLTGSLIRDSKIGPASQIGPYAHLRAGTSVDEEAKIGNFVEVKNSSIGPKSKAMHLSYLGDATLGKGVNIGAGTITCNYDGTHKHPTQIEDNVFVGSGTELVAPVTLKKNAFIAAGSTITDTVPEESLAIARMKQRIIPNWYERKSRKAKD